MQIPKDIISQWSEFVAYWCLGVEPAEAPPDVHRAFDALRRLWPEYLNKIEEQAQDWRGLSRIASAVERGLTLATCESLTGFEPVMARLRRGEESAFAELQFAAALVRSGLTPTLEPRVGSRLLDCSVEVGSARVFAEVVAPDRSGVAKEAEDMALQMAAKLVEITTGTRTEVLLEVDPDTQCDNFIAKTATILPDETVHRVEGIGWIRRDFLGPQPPNMGPLIFNPYPRPVIGVARFIKAENGICTSALIRVPISEERVHRLLRAEYRHFSPTEQNILVIRVSNGPRALSWWLPFIERWFQPERIRNVGAVVLYDQAQVGTPVAIRQRWRVVKNPYARVPVPDSLLHAILACDESSAWNRANSGRQPLAKSENFLMEFR